MMLDLKNLDEHQRAGLRDVWLFVLKPICGFLLLAVAFILSLATFGVWGFTVWIAGVVCWFVWFMARDIYRSAVKRSQSEAESREMREKKSSTHRAA